MNDMIKEKRNYKFSFLSLIFLTIILIPMVNNLFKLYSPGKLRENRKAAKKPKLLKMDYERYFKDFKNFYEDTFSFRPDLIFFNNYLRVKLFNVSPVDRVMIGKNGWLFIKKLKENNREIDYSRSTEKFSSADLALWGKIFKDRNRWLKDRGIRMFIVIVPNKSTIYSEYLPDNAKIMAKQVRTDQLISYFKDHSEIKILDLRKEMLKAKKSKRLYYKTDSHWNWFGTYIGYSKIIKYLSGFYTKVTRKPFDFFIRKRIVFSEGGDLATILSLQHTLFKERFFKLFPGESVSIKRFRLKKFHRKSVISAVTECRTGILPKTIMIHDSFGLRLRKMLSVHFSEIIYLRDWGFNFFPDLIEREKPKIVIYEMAERFLYNFSLKNPKEVSLE